MTTNEGTDKNLYDSLSEERDESAPVQEETLGKEGRGKKMDQDKKVEKNEWRSGPRKDDADYRLGPGWMHKERKSSRKARPVKEREKSPFEYTKEELLAFFQPNSVLPSDFVMIPNVCSEESLVPVNQSPQALKQFELLQQKYKNSISPAGRGRGRGRGRARGLDPRRKPDDPAQVYRIPRERGGRGGRYPSEAWKRDRETFFDGRREDEEDFAERRPKELRTPPGLEKIESDSWTWLYKDPQGKIQGPFTDQEMNDWLLAGYFPKNLPIKKITDDPEEQDFISLASFEGNPFNPKKRGVLRDETEAEPATSSTVATKSEQEDKGKPEKQEEPKQDKPGEVIEKKEPTPEPKKELPKEEPKKKPVQEVKTEVPLKKAWGAGENPLIEKVKPKAPEPVSVPTKPAPETKPEEAVVAFPVPQEPKVESKASSVRVPESPEQKFPQSASMPAVGPSGGAWPGPIKAWNAHELEMRQFEQLGHSADKDLPPQHIPQPTQIPRPQAFAQPPQPIPGNPPFVPPHFLQQQMFLQQQHAMHARQIEHFERKQGVYDMASIEEQLLKGAVATPPRPQPTQPIPSMRSTNPWGNPSVGEPQHPHVALHEHEERRKIHEQEMHRFRQPLPQEHHTPEEHHSHPFLAGFPEHSNAPSDGEAKVSPFQAMWGLNFDTAFSVHEIEAKMRQEREEEERKNQAKQQQEQPKNQERKQKPSPAKGKGAQQQAKQAKQGQPKQQKGQTKQKPKEESEAIEGEVVEESVWDIPQEVPQQTDKGASAPSKKQGKGAPSPSVWGGDNTNKPLPLHEIQKIERSESAKVSTVQPQSGKEPGMQHLLSVWGVEGTPSGQEQHAVPWGKELETQPASKKQAARGESKNRPAQPTEPQTTKKAADFTWGGSVPAEVDKKSAAKVDLRRIQEEEKKQQHQRQVELQAQQQKALAAAREQQNRWTSPWGAAAQEDHHSLSFKEIQEQEAIRRIREEEERRKRASAFESSDSHLPKGLWNPAPLNTEQPPSLLGIINEQAKLKAQQPHPFLGGPEEFVAGGILGWGPSAASGEKTSLTQIQEEEKKSRQKPQTQQQDSTPQKNQAKKQQPPQPQQAQQPQPAPPKESPNKKQKKPPQKSTSGPRTSAWDPVPQAPKASLSDIQAQEASISVPTQPKASLSTIVAETKPPYVPQKVPAPTQNAVDDDDDEDFWGDAPATKESSSGGAFSSPSDFPSLPSSGQPRSSAPAKAQTNTNSKKKGGNANAAPKKKADTQPVKTTSPAPASDKKVPAAQKNSNNSNTSKPRGGGNPPQAKGKRGGATGGGAAQPPSQTSTTTTTTTTSQGGGRGGGASRGRGGAQAGGQKNKPRMKKVDPSLLGFSSAGPAPGRHDDEDY